MRSTRSKAAGWVGISVLAAVGSFVVPGQSPAQSPTASQVQERERAYTELLPADRDEIDVANGAKRGRPVDRDVGRIP